MSDNITPSKSDHLTDYSSSHLHKGKDYHERFSSLPGRKLMWTQEQRLLAALLATLTNKDRYLDFASGTGRILTQVAPAFHQAYALDISPKMLSVAREQYPTAHFINADFRDDPAELADLTFDLITAFRFFPNAEAALRQDAMRYLTAHLKPGGYLIANNHRTHNSLPFRALRLLRHPSYSQGMPHREMKKLAHDASLHLHQTYSFGIVPQTEDRAILPWFLVQFLENINYYLAANKHRLGYNTLYVFVKTRE